MYEFEDLEFIEWYVTNVEFSNLPIGKLLLYLLNTNLITAKIRSRSLSVRLEPEGKHKPFSNRVSDIVPP